MTREMSEREFMRKIGDLGFRLCKDGPLGPWLSGERGGFGCTYYSGSRKIAFRDTLARAIKFKADREREVQEAMERKAAREAFKAGLPANIKATVARIMKATNGQSRRENFEPWHDMESAIASVLLDEAGKAVPK